MAYYSVKKSQTVEIDIDRIYSLKIDDLRVNFKIIDTREGHHLVICYWKCRTCGYFTTFCLPSDSLYKNGLKCELERLLERTGRHLDIRERKLLDELTNVEAWAN